MRGVSRIFIIALAFIALAHSGYAQYYSWGSDRASLKWSRIEGESASVIYPDSVELTARRTMHYVDAIEPYIAFGYRELSLDIPFVIHPDNFASNGMVMWMPKRIEFLSTPAIDSYSMPWVKQLVAHEYRHAVQYNNVNQSTVKFFSYLLGQQAPTVGLLFPPLFAIEGDAVLMETQMSTYGRALQPSYSIEYRAIGEEVLEKGSRGKWLCGSYRTNVPDHYKLGYQVMSYAYEKYNENIMDRALWYASRNPYYIVPFPLSLKKFYNTSSKELYDETFSELNRFWQSLPQVEDSAQIISEIEEENYTTYSHPIMLDKGRILSLKSDYNRPSRFVIFDTKSGDESKVAYTGSVSTRPAYADGRVWWSEYRRSLLFDEDVDSQLCYMDLDNANPKRVNGVKAALYPTPIGDTSNHIAYVEYAPDGSYSVVEMKDLKEICRIEIEYPTEVHSLAWDNLTRRLYIIVTGEEGMWIEQQEGDHFEPITKGAYITISNLRAVDGVLYFGSIESGKDEVHSLDLSSGVELQLTESKFGSFQPSVSDGQMALTTYDKYGYHLSTQSVDESIREVEYSNVPTNVVNPERKRWDVINLDTVRFDSVALDESREEYKAKGYSKMAHLIDIHSWAPVRFDPYNIISEKGLDIGIGATLLTQNLLSSLDGYFSYGWDHYDGSVLRTGLKYDGLGVNMSLYATYGGVQNSYFIEPESVGTYADITYAASLPLFYQRGYRSRQFTPSVAWSYSNGLLPETYALGVDAESGATTIYVGGVKQGLNKFSTSLTYSEYIRATSKDVAVPWGVVASVSYALDPLNSDFSHIAALYTKLYTPGLALHNSFTVEAAYQDVFGGLCFNGIPLLSYMASSLTPRGFSYTDVGNSEYMALSANYQFPLCYPEFGFASVFYVKRLRFNMGADYASYGNYAGGRSDIHSYGADLYIDCNILSTSSSSTSSVKLSLYRPSVGDFYFQFGLELPF